MVNEVTLKTIMVIEKTIENPKHPTKVREVDERIVVVYVWSEMGDHKS